VLAGTLGTYALTSLLTVAVSRLMIHLGVDAVEAVTGATLASFAAFAAVSMAVFHATSPARAWFWLFIFSGLCGLAILALQA
jgi:hypothetical protein